MNKRQKKKNNIGQWKLIKLNPDISWYELCENCKFYHDISKKDTILPTSIDLNISYNYCPVCGRKMKKPNIDSYDFYKLNPDTYDYEFVEMRKVKK